MKSGNEVVLYEAVCRVVLTFLIMCKWAKEKEPKKSKVFSGRYGEIFRGAIIPNAWWCDGWRPTEPGKRWPYPKLRHRGIFTPSLVRFTIPYCYNRPTAIHTISAHPSNTHFETRVTVSIVPYEEQPIGRHVVGDDHPNRFAAQELHVIFVGPV